VSRTAESYPTSAFDYDLPPDRIARYPLEHRDASRLLVVDRATGRIRHSGFSDIVARVPAGDALVLNDSRVIPARLVGRKSTGARGEVLLLHPVDAGDANLWRALVRPGSKLRAGADLRIDDTLHVEIVSSPGDGTRVVRLHTDLPVREALERAGTVPLPPYLGRAAEPSDRERYQTVYARREGSVAAPTAGLHFTTALLDALAGRGVIVARLTLHVGLGTFRPVETKDPGRHALHAEHFAVDAATAACLNEVRRRGGALWAVGTTVARTLETLATERGRLHAGEGWTSLFIRPPWKFRATDHLITNFHLPRSTLLMLVSAFGGHDLIMRAYADAVREGYRFYSYGDSMVVL
jgi:S-adenosylmethionine:tRNA ribosyltransferase-isomerase